MTTTMERTIEVEKMGIPASGNFATPLPRRVPVEIFWEHAPSSRQQTLPSGAAEPTSFLNPSHPNNHSSGTIHSQGSLYDDDRNHRDDDASMKDLWLNLVLDRLAPTNTAPKLHFIERNVAAYSPGEMEALCRRWQRAETGWKTLASIDAPPPAERPMDLELQREGIRFLLPGGRWLFSFGRTISYYNLDLAMPEPQNLVDLLPPQMPTEAPITLRVSPPDLDAKSPTLVFNIAIVLPSPSTGPQSSTSPPPTEPKSMVQIWRIRLRASSAGRRGLGVTGSGGEFVSQQLSSFPCSRDTAGIRCVSLSGANVAISGREGDEGERYTEIIDWVAATGESLLFPRRVLRTCYDHIHLLAQSSAFSQPHLFAYNRHTLALFAHALLAPSSSPSSPRLPAKHAIAWQGRIEKGEKPSACSQPYICNGSTRFVVYSSGTVYGVIISTPATETSSRRSSGSDSRRRSASPPIRLNPSATAAGTAPPVPARLVTLAHLPTLGVAVSPLAVPVLGYRHAVFSAAAVTKEQSLVVVSYEWPEGDLPSPEGPFKTRPAQAQARMMRVRNLGAKGVRMPDADGMLMDEGTGRLVLAPQFGGDAEMGAPLTVIDLGGDVNDAGRRTSVFY